MSLSAVLSGNGNESEHPVSVDHTPYKSCDPTPAALPPTVNATSVISESCTPQAVPRHIHSLTASNHKPSCTALQPAPNLTSVEVPACVQVLSDLPDPAGLKSAHELNQFWSPSETLGHIVPSRGDSTSHSSGHTSLNPPSRPSLQPSDLSTPISDSTMSSAQHTPGPLSSANAFNYSPTASVDGEMVHNRGMTQSAIHSTGFFEDSNAASNIVPLSQSVMIPRSGDSSSHVSPMRSLHSTKEQSFKKKLGRFIGLLTQKGKGESPDNDGITEGFTEIFVSDLERERVKKTHQQAVGVPGSVEEMGEECFATSPVQMAASSAQSGSRQASPEEDQEAVKSKRNSAQQDEEILKISNLPISTRTTRTNSESSTQDPQGEFTNNTDDQLPRTALLIGSYQNNGPTETVCSRYSASYPERSPTLKRSRNSKSETNATQTVIMVQERLQRLVEATESGNHSFLSSSVSNTVKAVEQSADKLVSSGEEDPLTTERPKLGTFVSMDSTKTLRVPSPTDEPKETMAVSGGAVQPSQSAPSVVSKAPSELATSGSRMFIRRVSVCSPRQPDQQQQQRIESHNDSMHVTPTDSNPSPVALLDQFVARGEILHRGHFESIPLTELEGVDWNHFGGCPHSEEFGMMRSQVALLHSQLLFERHQCLQHARRNRRLLSRARMATQITEELLSLVSVYAWLDDYDM